MLVRGVPALSPGGRSTVGVVLSLCSAGRNTPGRGVLMGPGLLCKGIGGAVAGGGGDRQQGPLPCSADGGGYVGGVSVDGRVGHRG